MDTSACLHWFEIEDLLFPPSLTIVSWIKKCSSQQKLDVLKSRVFCPKIVRWRALYNSVFCQILPQIFFSFYKNFCGDYGNNVLLIHWAVMKYFPKSCCHVLVLRSFFCTFIEISSIKFSLSESAKTKKTCFNNVKKTDPKRLQNKQTLKLYVRFHTFFRSLQMLKFQKLPKKKSQLTTKSQSISIDKIRNEKYLGWWMSNVKEIARLCNSMADTISVWAQSLVIRI